MTPALANSEREQANGSLWRIARTTSTPTTTTLLGDPTR